MSELELTEEEQKQIEELFNIIEKHEAIIKEKANLIEDIRYNACKRMGGHGMAVYNWVCARCGVKHWRND